uniref:Colony stimulating factor 3 n=1 Tax=Nothoprocta perdicaria TaxID=30464 RepID=A0A8C6ZL71_NOTPE
LGPPAALPLLALALAAPLWPALRAAPLPDDVSGDHDFQLFLRKSLEFGRKIKGDVAALQDVVCETFQLCQEEELWLVRQHLDVPAAPLERCQRPGFEADACLEQLHGGLRVLAHSLGAVRELLPAHADLVERLQLDAANLSSNIQQQMEELGLPLVTFPPEGPGVLPAVASRFHQQVGSFFLLRNFQRFLETALRALRHLARR